MTIRADACEHAKMAVDTLTGPFAIGHPSVKAIDFIHEYTLLRFEVKKTNSRSIYTYAQIVVHTNRSVLKRECLGLREWSSFLWFRPSSSHLVRTWVANQCCFFFYPLSLSGTRRSLYLLLHPNINISSLNNILSLFYPCSTPLSRLNSPKFHILKFNSYYFEISTKCQ